MNLRQKFICFLRENRILVLIILAALFVAILPLLSADCVNGHDIEYHLLRIEALKEGILSGKPFLKVNMLYFGGRGYASSMFYPDFMLYIPAVLRAAGCSIAASYHSFVAICILLTFAAMYYAIKLVTKELKISEEKKRLAAAAGAICYTLSQYHIDDIYTRAAVGEFTAMIFIPLVMVGLFEFLKGRLEHPYTLIAGFGGLILCHTITTLFMGVLFIVCFLIRLPKYIKSPKEKLLPVIGCGVSVLALTAFYYIPMLEQFAGAAFNTGKDIFDLNYEKLMVRDLFANANPALGVWLPLVCLCLGGIYLVFGESKEKTALEDSEIDVDNKAAETNETNIVPCFAHICAAIAIIFTLMTTGLLPWARLQRFLGFLQFPWRLLIIATPFMCMAAALYFACWKTDNMQFVRAGAIFITGLMIMSAVGNISRIDEGYYSYSDDYYSHIPYTGNVIGGEWLPQTVTDRSDLLKDCDKAIAADGKEIEVMRSANELSFDVDTAVDYVDVPFIYYKGYAARTADGQTLEVDGLGTNGSVRVYTKDVKGAIQVYYEGTLTQHLTTVISSIYVIGIVFIFFKKKRERSQIR